MSKENDLPLCVDLDGTLIKSDTLQYTLVKYLQLWPHKILNIFIWLMRGRAHLKAMLAKHIKIDAHTFAYNPQFLSWLKAQSQNGRALFLVTASDQKAAQAFSQFIPIFQDTMASNGSINLRAGAKAQALIDRFGRHQFAYAGNSKDDLTVWQNCGQIIAVNTPKKIFLQAKHLNTPFLVFDSYPQFLKILRAFRPSWITSLLFLPMALAHTFYAKSWTVLIPHMALSTTMCVTMHLLYALWNFDKQTRANLVLPKIEHALNTGQVTIAQCFKATILLSIGGLLCGYRLPLQIQSMSLSINFIYLVLLIHLSPLKMTHVWLYFALLCMIFLALITY